MSIHADNLRSIGTFVCEEAADEIESLEKAYALLFSDHAALRRKLDALAAPSAQPPVPKTVLEALEIGLGHTSWAAARAHFGEGAKQYNTDANKIKAAIADLQALMAASPSAQPSGAPEVPAGFVTLDSIQADFLAARLRRLFAHFDYTLPDFASEDASLIRIAGSIIGGILANLDRATAPPFRAVLAELLQAHDAWNWAVGTDSPTCGKAYERLAAARKSALAAFSAERFATAPTPSGAPADTTKDQQ